MDKKAKNIPRNLRVSFPLLSIRHHGGVKVVISLANHLAQRGWRVSLITPKDRFNPHYPISERVSLILTPRVGRFGPLSHLLALLYLLLWIPRSDLLVANFFPTFYPSYLKGKLGYGKLLYLIQDYEPWFRGFPYNLFAALSYRLKSAQVVVSKWLQGQLGGSPPVANPGPTAKFFPDKAGDLLRGKGERRAILYLWSSPYRGRVSMFREVVRGWQRDDVELWIVGGKGVETGLKMRLFPLLKEDELRKVYSAADLLLHLSPYEGFGLPPLEAMACGTPGVLTDSGGVRDYARDGYNCLLVKGDPGRIRKAVELLLLDDQLRERLAQGGLETAAHFSMEKMARRFEGLLREEIA